MMLPKKLTIAIDPEVLWGATDFDDRGCQTSLMEIHDNKACFDPVFGNHELDKHYENFIRSQSNTKSKWVANLISTLRTHYPTRNCPTLEEAPESVRACTTPHVCPPEEQLLLRIAVQMNKHSLTSPRIILLMRCQKNSSTRCLYQSSTAICLKEQISGLEIFCANTNERKLMALHKAPTNHDQHVNSFELQTGEIIANLYECPEKLTHEKVKGEQVDFYHFQKAGNPRLVCIGECKLRFNDEEKEIEGADIDQLARKIKAVQEYEQERRDVQSDFEIVSFIVTNAKGMDMGALCRIVWVKLIIEV